MRPPSPPSVELPRPRRSPWGGVLALVLHGLLIGFIIIANWREVLSWSPVTRIGDPEAGRGGGGGGGGARAVALPAFQRPQAQPAVTPAPVPPPPPEVVPEPTPVPPPPPPAEVAPPTPAPTDTATSPSPGQGGTGTGGGKGTGTGTGTGSGAGPGTGPGSGPGSGGEGGRGFPPEPRQVILPPLDYPRSLRGATVAVTFWVRVDGRVERVEMQPEIEDRGFAKKFAEVMRSYRFRPARSPEGQVIAGTTTVRVSF